MTKTMNQKALNIISELENKLKTQGFQLVYCYKNICIKSDPTSLLSVVVDDGFEERKLEEVAYIALPEDNKFKMEVYPKYDFLLEEIALSIKDQHPEFKLEILKEEKPESSDEDEYNVGGDGDSFYLELTMPPVNKKYHDLATTYVKNAHDAIKTSMSVDYTAYSAKVAFALEGDGEKSAKQVKDVLEEVKGKYEKLVDDQQKEKLDEIEEAYAKWLEEHPGADKAEAPDAPDAPDMPDVPEEGSALSMKMEG